MRTLYVDCSSGAAGDMITAALIDCGVPIEVITEPLEKLGITCTVSTVQKGSLRAIHFEVAAETDHHRTYRNVVEMIGAAKIDPGVTARALGAFELLAAAESKIHDQPIESVHFHEVGAVDSIADVVAASAAFEHLRIDRVVVSPIATGRGTTDSMHGSIPVPAPAVLEILEGAELYERGERELITPTGAALLKSWATSFGPMPRMKLETVGYGAGTADLAWPNVVRVLVGESAETTRSSAATELLETNIDDMSPELVPYVIGRILEAGALDAWSTPVQMKKGRLGMLLSALVEKGATQPVLDVIFAETTTFGVRISEVERAVLDRKMVDAEVAGHIVPVKVGYRDGEPITMSPEFEAAADVARATGIALKDVYRMALENLQL